MNIRTYSRQVSVCATSRFRLPKKVNDEINAWNKIAHIFHAKATVIPGIERPFGPFGNWSQNITVTIEGDYDDPKCQKLFDVLFSGNFSQLTCLIEEELHSDNKTNNTSGTGSNEVKYSTVNSNYNPAPQGRSIVVAGSDTSPLLKRMFMFLEDGDWNRANEYCETVLDLEPENAQAYLGKLMVELKVRNSKDLQNQAEPFDKNNNYQKAVRFADDMLKNTLVGYIDHINDRNEKARKETTNVADETAFKNDYGNNVTVKYSKAIKQETCGIRDKKPINIDTPAATFACSIGHWRDGLFGKKWIANKVGNNNVWDFKVDIKYSGKKSARKIAIYAVAHDMNDIPYEPQRIFLYEKELSEGMTITNTWTPCWVGKSIGRIRILKTKIYFCDGTMQENNY